MVSFIVEETGVPGENLLYHIMLYTSPWSKFELTTSVVIGTDCIGNLKSNYHTITTTKAPNKLMIIGVKGVEWITLLEEKFSHVYLHPYPF